MNCVKRLGFENVAEAALKEDTGRGDVTAKLAIPAGLFIDAVIIAKEKGVLCGLELAKSVFRKKDGSVKFSSGLKDGDIISKGLVVAKIRGRARSILSSERVALNFLSFLSGIATRTSAFVRKTRPFKVRILDTRKTLPGLRQLEKYAVRTGGAFNHRFSLDEMILIKENHIDIAGWEKISRAVKNNRGSKIKTEIEARNLKEFKYALFLKPDIIMLDNMSLRDIREAVRLRNKAAAAAAIAGPKLEASGNINLANIVSYAACGIDFISLGTLTKDIDSLDFSLEVKSKRR
ncbi:MAG: carboxylating nicotinate-nucleotide diphosphorylase [Candidatus Omnitrophica bacterium]|nr:carboxylating nicotinate-nucleotide diphosphorylase [Candidatus Omnitrophota bacterium]